jgi:hypothetical protein
VRGEIKILATCNHANIVRYGGSYFKDEKLWVRVFPATAHRRPPPPIPLRLQRVLSRTHARTHARTSRCCGAWRADLHGVLRGRVSE